MNRRENRNPALVELILVLLFFSLSAVVLVQVFVKAHLISQESQAQTLGLLQTQDVIERWKEAPDQPEAVFSPENGWEETKTVGEERSFSMNCGEDFVPMEKEQASYEVRSELWTEETAAGSLYHIRVRVISLRNEKTEVELTTARYISEK